MMLRCVITLVCWMSISPVWADDWQYTLRPGDELWSIARDYCGSGNRAAAIAKHNGLTDGAALRAGQRIKIPTQWLAFAPSQARVEEVLGAVYIQARAAKAEKKANNGDRLQMGDVLFTRNGAALISFADSSTLAVQPNSQILFNKLTAFGPAGMVDTHLRFARGRGKAMVQPQNRGDRFRIQTPEGIAAVRGTVFRVGHQQQEGISKSNTETIEGEVQFASTAAVTDLPAGFGVVASPSGVVKQALLPAPTLLPVAASLGQGASFNWQAVKGAQAYLVSWAQQASPEIVVLQTPTVMPTSTVAVEPGAYLISIRGISDVGIEGYDAQFALRVDRSAPMLSKVTNEIAGAVDLGWQASDGQDNFTVSMQASHWQTPRQWQVEGVSHTVDLPAGHYEWSVKSQESAVSEKQAFTLQPAPVDNVVAKSRNKDIRLSWSGGADQYVVMVTDPEGGKQTYHPTEAKLTLKELPFGDYRVDIASRQNSLQSEPYSLQIKVAQRPWWIAVFITILAI